MSKFSVLTIVFLTSLFCVVTKASPLAISFYRSNSCSESPLAIVNLESQVGDDEKLIRQNLQQCSDSSMALLKAGVKDRSVMAYSINGNCTIQEKKEALGSSCLGIAIGLATYPEAFIPQNSKPGFPPAPEKISSSCNPNDIIFTEEIEAPKAAGQSKNVLNKYCKMVSHRGDCVT
jgi:hypothetical protein